MTKENEYQLSFEQCKLIPFADVFSWLGIKCEKGSIFENGKETSGWKLNEAENIVNDFSTNNRPKGDTVSFVKAHLNLQSNNDARQELAKQFGARYGTLQLANKPQEKSQKQYIDVKDKWNDLKELGEEGIEYLKSRGVQYSKVKKIVRENKNGIACALKNEKHETINIKVRSIDPNAEQRFWQEKGASPYGVYMGDFDEEVKYLLLTEGMFDFLTAYQVYKNAIGLNTFKNGLEILKHYQQKGFKVLYIHDNDDAGIESKKELEKMFGDNLKCVDLSRLGEFKDLNEFYVKNPEIDLLNFFKNPEEYIEKLEVKRLLGKKTEESEPITENQNIPYTWGTEELDKIISPIQRHHFIVLSGETGSGKTAWVFDVARKNARDGHNVAFISLEMTTEGIKTRDAREYAGITKEQWRKKSLISETQKNAYEKRKEYLDSLKNLNLIGFPKDEKITTATVEKIIKHTEFDLIIIDNLDCIQKENDAMRDFDHEREIANMCMRVTNDIKRPVLMIHHLRKSNDRMFKPRGMDEFKGSGKITHNADMVLLVYRKPFDKVDTPEEKAELVIYQLKDRDFGVGGKKKIYFNRGTFEDFWRNPNPQGAEKMIQNVMMPPPPEPMEPIQQQIIDY